MEGKLTQDEQWIENREKIDDSEYGLRQCECGAYFTVYSESSTIKLCDACEHSDDEEYDEWKQNGGDDYLTNLLGTETEVVHREGDEDKNQGVWW